MTQIGRISTTKHVIDLGRHQVDTHKLVIGDGIRRHVKNGTRSAHVVVELDYTKMRQYAEKALRNAKGSCQLAHGAIFFRVLKTTIEVTTT